MCVCVSREVEEVMGQRVAQVNMELEMAKESNASLLRQLGSVKVCTMCVLMHTGIYSTESSGAHASMFLLCTPTAHHSHLTLLKQIAQLHTCTTYVSVICASSFGWRVRMHFSNDFLCHIRHYSISVSYLLCTFSMYKDIQY